MIPLNKLAASPWLMSCSSFVLTALILTSNRLGIV
jgi:hypothetical protein